MNHDETLKNLPHAFPFRMIDRILDIEPGKKAIALKNVSIDELFIQGHFPKEPVMPWVLVLEAMAQTGGLAFESSFEKKEEREGVPILVRVDEFRMRKHVLPGDRLILEANIEKIFSHLARVKVLARITEETVAEAVLVLARGATTDQTSS